ncbi:hypothetical protein BCR43DRAFT_514445 [Syncephalastrum racemosum]|uniref:Secreted protein n=1 Tax=Syncephalastrum racemosum TaxID=13706 RepID=A0A1X2HGL8_SYNRA|nr:hypothetical protein BCR43DRAFT_514445 [Syncephalastrum racemosum]
MHFSALTAVVSCIFVLYLAGVVRSAPVPAGDVSSGSSREEMNASEAGQEPATKQGDQSATCGVMDAAGAGMSCAVLGVVAP